MAKRAERNAVRPKSDPGEARWWLFFHQIPPRPNYLRVKIGRRLARIGAVGLKNTVYALPRTEAAHEDLQWIAREIVAGGGDATLVEARFVEGLSDDEVVGLFQRVRGADWTDLAASARKVGRAVPGRIPRDHERRAGAEADIARLRARADEIAAIDFFGAPGREAAIALVEGLEARLRAPRRTDVAGATLDRDSLRGRVWVTREGVGIDRIATAWLVRRFVDPGARFRFVPAKGHAPRRGEVRFDMFEADFTHEGEDCTFEVLKRRLAIDEPGLDEVAEVVHDVDVKDAKFARHETPGIAGLVAGLSRSCESDEDRLERGFAIFDALRAFYAAERPR